MTAKLEAAFVRRLRLWQQCEHLGKDIPRIYGHNGKNLHFTFEIHRFVQQLLQRLGFSGDHVCNMRLMPRSFKGLGAGELPDAQSFDEALTASKWFPGQEVMLIPSCSRCLLSSSWARTLCPTRLKHRIRAVESNYSFSPKPICSRASCCRLSVWCCFSARTDLPRRHFCRPRRLLSVLVARSTNS